ncbi:MAG: hypothetical protein EXS46_01615 [Candidatus Taylorbacteria bacterium]|nr:hypothetical protein [Candidatus Taylorbacteria bacterium]
MSTAEYRNANPVSTTPVVAPVAAPAPVVAPVQTSVSIACAATTLNSYSVPSKNSGESATVSVTNSISNGNRLASNTFICNNGTFTAGTETSSITCNSGYLLSGSQCIAPTPVVAPVVTTSSYPSFVTTDRQKAIADLYKTLLNRDPDQGGLQYWDSTGSSVDYIRTVFMSTAEYRALHPTSSAGAVNQMASALESLKATLESIKASIGR